MLDVGVVEGRPVGCPVGADVGVARGEGVGVPMRFFPVVTE